jgi:muconolactone D-isomerase
VPPENHIQLAAFNFQTVSFLGFGSHLWRVAGKYANVSVFDVESADDLHEILNSLPLYPFMDIEVTALCHHPGWLGPAFRGQSGAKT